MSNFLGLAAVTATLRNLLQKAFDASPLSPVNVTTHSPDKLAEFSSNDRSGRLNVFLYHTQPSAAWRNQEPPRGGRSSDGVSPPLALDLHYLLTASEKTDGDVAVTAHRVFGFALGVLHDHPLLGADEIANALAGTGLERQIERIRLTPHSLSVEEMSKLWTAFQGPYRLSAAYQASVVLIDSTRPRPVAPPVSVRKLLVVPFLRPSIQTIVPQTVASGGTLRLEGINLRGDQTRVVFGDTLVTPADPQADVIEIAVPGTLAAGVHTVQVKHLVNFGTLADPHRGLESNVAAFMLTPVITPSGGAPAFNATAGAAFSVDVTPAVGALQEAVLLIGDRSVARPLPPPASPPAATLTFTTPADLAPGTYLLRLRVDGADSPLTRETNEASPNFNRYTGPFVTVA